MDNNKEGNVMSLNYLNERELYVKKYLILAMIIISIISLTIAIQQITGPGHPTIQDNMDYILYAMGHLNG